jgi:anhydro-N-acetylmuramic acid kinase
MRQLQKKLPNFKVASTSAYGLHADCVEAVAFAWFAQQTLNGQPIDFSAFTGSSGAVIAGGIYQAV